MITSFHSVPGSGTALAISSAKFFIADASGKISVIDRVSSAVEGIFDHDGTAILHLGITTDGTKMVSVTKNSILCWKTTPFELQNKISDLNISAATSYNRKLAILQSIDRFWKLQVYSLDDLSSARVIMTDRNSMCFALNATTCFYGVGRNFYACSLSSEKDSERRTGRSGAGLETRRFVTLSFSPSSCLAGSEKVIVYSASQQQLAIFSTKLGKLASFSQLSQPVGITPSALVLQETSQIKVMPLLGEQEQASEAPILMYALSHTHSVVVVEALPQQNAIHILPAQDSPSLAAAAPATLPSPVVSQRSHSDSPPSAETVMQENLQHAIADEEAPCSRPTVATPPQKKQVDAGAEQPASAEDGDFEMVAEVVILEDDDDD